MAAILNLFSISMAGSYKPIFHNVLVYTASIKPMLLFSRAGYASWGLSLSSVYFNNFAWSSWQGSRFRRQEEEEVIFEGGMLSDGAGQDHAVFLRWAF